MNRLDVAILLVMLAVGCISKPEPWSPDEKIGDADTGLRNTDGTGELGSPDVVVEDLVEVTSDVVLPEDIPDIQPDIVDVVALPDLVEVMPETVDVVETIEETVCDPVCDGIECGDDGCGGTCGECKDEKDCILGTCHPDYCAEGLQDFGCCFGEVVFWCEEDKLKLTECAPNNPPYNICGWKSDKYECGGDGEDPDGLLPLDCCVGDCTDKECGGNGCWGSCGECGDNEECTEGNCDCVTDSVLCENICCPVGQVCSDGSCCTLDCDGKECGPDGCGGDCGECEGTNCTSDWCGNDGKCWSEIDNFSCVIEETCVPSGALKPGNDCQACDPSESKTDWSNKEDGIDCGQNKACQAGDCTCVGPACNSGCCDAGQVCNGETCCTPNCDGKDCGGDGCGGSCGWCMVCGEECIDGTCTFTNCDGKSCGPNGCGGSGSCGDCPGPQDECQNGQCVCQPDCDSKECGDDGCDGSCGGCDEGYLCNLGTCSSAWWKDPGTGLAWENPSGGAGLPWGTAVQYCDNLEFDGGGWRMPSIDELRSLVRGCVATATNGSCNISNSGCLSQVCMKDDCNGCTSGQGPAGGCYWPSEMLGDCQRLWSSDFLENEPSEPWMIWFDMAYVGNGYAPGTDVSVRCVKTSW